MRSCPTAVMEVNLNFLLLHLVAEGAAKRAILRIVKKALEGASVSEPNSDNSFSIANVF